MYGYTTNVIKDGVSMKKIIFLTCLLFFIILAGCGLEDKQQASISKEESSIHFNHEAIGLKLDAYIKTGQQITVEASLENISDEAIIYNNRCGEPFYITMKLDDTAVYLKSDEEPMACIEIFDPNDLVELAPGEKIKKVVTFTREFGLQEEETVPTLDGTYLIEFSFTTYGTGHFYASTPTELSHSQEPDILTLEEAIEKAVENSEVKQWRENKKQQGMEIRNEEAFISDGKWYVMFHAIGEEFVERIIVPVDIYSGEVDEINKEELPKDEATLQWIESQGS